jgi:hypothetical protein
MHGAILPLPQYAFMAWSLVKLRDNFYHINVSVKPQIPNLMKFRLIISKKRVDRRRDRHIEIRNSEASPRIPIVRYREFFLCAPHASSWLATAVLWPVGTARLLLSHVVTAPLLMQQPAALPKHKCDVRNVVH